MHAVLQFLILAGGLLAIHGAVLGNSDKRTDLLQDVNKLENLRSTLEGLMKRDHQHSGQGSAERKEEKEECQGPLCILFHLADIRDALRDVGTPEEVLNLINEIKTILAALGAPAPPAV